MAYNFLGYAQGAPDEDPTSIIPEGTTHIVVTGETLQVTHGSNTHTYVFPYAHIYLNGNLIVIPAGEFVSLVNVVPGDSILVNNNVEISFFSYVANSTEYTPLAPNAFLLLDVDPVLPLEWGSLNNYGATYTAGAAKLVTGISTFINLGFDWTVNGEEDPNLEFYYIVSASQPNTTVNVDPGTVGYTKITRNSPIMVPNNNWVQFLTYNKGSANQTGTYTVTNLSNNNTVLYTGSFAGYI